MIIMLILVMLTIGCVALHVYGDRNHVFWADLLGAIGGMVIGVLVILWSLCITITQLNKEVAYENAIYEKQVLEYRIDNIDNDTTGNELLYSDIVEFNNALRHTKKWANNPFTNWFHVKKIASIDYIEFEMANDTDEVRQ